MTKDKKEYTIFDAIIFSVFSLIITIAIKFFVPLITSNAAEEHLSVLIYLIIIFLLVSNILVWFSAIKSLN